MSLDLSVVIAALNESGNIGQVVAGVRETARRLGAACEVLVADGDSADATVAEARAAGARVLERTGGFADSLRAAIRETRGEYILIIDGDGSHPIDRLPEMWQRRKEADVVVGSRLVVGGGLELPLHRRLLTKILNGFFRSIMGIPVADSSSGYRLYRGDALRAVKGRSRGFEFQQETLLKIIENGGTAVEVPILYIWRREGESKARILPLGLGYIRTVIYFWSEKLRAMTEAA